MMTPTVKHALSYLRGGAPTLALAVLGGLTSMGCSAELGTDPDDPQSTGGSGAIGGSGGSSVADPPEFTPAGGVDEVICEPGTARHASPRIWRLTRRQYDRSVTSLVGDESNPAEGFVPEPGSEQGFQNDAYSLRVRQLEAGQFQAAAKALAANVVQNRLEDILPCDEAQLTTDTCQQSFVEEFGARAFRRPLSVEEKERYLSLFQLGTQKGDAKLGLTVSIEAMLQSPYFLYRFELGDFDPANPGEVVLTEHEVASALSYLLTDAPPDEALRASVSVEDLSDPLVRRQHAERLLASAPARDAQLEFYRQLFEYLSLEEVMKDPDVFPEFDSLRDSFHREMDAYAGHVVFESDGSLQTLLTASYTFADSTLGDFLGIEVSGDSFVQTTTDPGERAGILSLAGFNAVTSAQTRTSPVNRGRFIREKLLCYHIGEPPQGIDLTLPTLEAGMTAREQLEQKTSPPACAGCHSVMNPVGFGMESLDALGRFRTEDNSLPIDDQGELTETRDIDGPFSGVPELADRLAQSKQVEECFAIQAFRYASGRGETSSDSCSLVELRDLFIASGGNLKELPIAFAVSDGFIHRDGKP